MASPVVHFEIASTDPAGTKRFVAEMFGWKLEEIPGPFDYSMVDTGVEGAIRGGVGTLLGTIFGVFIPAVLQNGFVIVGVQPFWQQVAVGASTCAPGNKEHAQPSTIAGSH